MMAEQHEATFTLSRMPATSLSLEVLCREREQPGPGQQAGSEMQARREEGGLGEWAQAVWAGGFKPGP